MNINEAVEKIVEIDLLRVGGYRQEIANILQELLDTGGVGKEYMEKGE